MTAMPESPAGDASAREIVLSRVFDAPRELVFKVWTEPEHVVHWWGPNGFTTTIHEMDVRPGGKWDFIMHGPDGTDYPNHVVYEEIVPPERLVYTHGGGEGHEDVQFRATITFSAEGGRTRVTLRSVFPTAAARERVVREYGAIEGGQQHLARLADYLAAQPRG
jgi:uncharacterized protein YndB with AHSA1/START domain